MRSRISFQQADSHLRVATPELDMVQSSTYIWYCKNRYFWNSTKMCRSQGWSSWVFFVDTWEEHCWLEPQPLCSSRSDFMVCVSFWLRTRSIASRSCSSKYPIEVTFDLPFQPRRWIHGWLEMFHCLLLSCGKGLKLEHFVWGQAPRGQERKKKYIEVRWDKNIRKAPGHSGTPLQEANTSCARGTRAISLTPELSQEEGRWPPWTPLTL